MAMSLRPLHPVFVAEASDIDLSKQLDADAVDRIKAAMDQYAVLVFRNQQLEESTQLRFAKSLGTIDLGMKVLVEQRDRMQFREMIDISNINPDGELAKLTDAKILRNVANQLWHSDSSFLHPSARYSTLFAVVIPPEGGATQFADMRAAYDNLPPDLKHEIEGLQAEHFVIHSRSLLGDTTYNEEHVRAMPPVHWPVVRTHQGSKRKHLFIGAHARSIVGQPVPQGRLLLWDLLELATQPQFVYTHTWRVGDLVMWDNRCTLHRGRRYDFSQRRELHRVTTLDVDETREVGSELAA